MADAIPLNASVPDAATEAAPLGVAAAAGPLDVSIIVVTWNSGRWITRCLASIPAACSEGRYEVIVFDNASTDETLSIVDTFDLRVARAAGPAGRIATRVIRSAENHGFAGGVNRAAAAARGRYLFLLNPDVELEPNALSTLRAFLDDNPSAAAAAPLMDGEEGDSQREFQLRRFPSLVTFAFEILAISRSFPNNKITARYRYRDLDLTHPQKVEQPAAAALLIRRDAFSAVGAFDERFTPAWFEDVDYSRRMAQRGLDIYVVPRALVRHVGGASLEHMSFEEFNEAWYANMWRYAHKWFPPGKAEALRWLIIFGMAMRWLAVLAGIAHRDVGRRRALRAFSGVLRRAFSRWGQ